MCIYVITADGGFVDLSPQERMKLRMHEKAKKKTAVNYSVQQLLEKVTLATYLLQRPYQDYYSHYILIANMFCTDRGVHGQF